MYIAPEVYLDEVMFKKHKRKLFIGMTCFVGTVIVSFVDTGFAKAASMRFAYGDFVRSTSHSGLHVWSTPCGNHRSQHRGRIRTGKQAQISSYQPRIQTCSYGTYTWYKINILNGTWGWVAGEFLTGDTSKLGYGRMAAVRTTSPSQRLWTWDKPWGGRGEWELSANKRVFIRERYWGRPSGWRSRFTWYKIGYWSNWGWKEKWVAGEYLQRVRRNNNEPGYGPNRHSWDGGRHFSFSISSLSSLESQLSVEENRIGSNIESDLEELFDLESLMSANDMSDDDTLAYMGGPIDRDQSTSVPESNSIVSLLFLIGLCSFFLKRFHHG